MDFLDTDLEFQSFPHLFVPGSWPNGGRDVAIFNYWGNESDWEHASTPTTGSGVVLFNQTQRSRAVLTANTPVFSHAALNSAVPPPTPK